MRPTALFISEKTLKERGLLDDSMDGKVIRASILTVQESKILPLLGSALYDKLSTLINTNAVADFYATLLNNYIVNVMVEHVMCEIVFNATIKVKNRGAVKKTGDDTETLSMTDMFSVMDEYKRRAEVHEERLIRYLNHESGANNFPEYANPGDRGDAVHPKRKSFSLPIVLGDNSGCRPRGYDYDRNDLI